MTEFLGNMYSWFTFIPKITLSNLFEILILTVLIYEVLLWVKSTRAGVLLRGGMIIVGFYLLAAMLLAIGVVSLINYLRKDISGIIYRYDLVVGLCAILGGILVIVKVDKLTDLIPAVLGFLVTMSGIMKMQNSVDMLRLGHGTWHVAFAMAIVNIVAGIVLLMNPFEAAQILIMCLGIALVYSGITDLYVTISISRRLSRLKTEIVVAENDSEE